MDPLLLRFGAPLVSPFLSSIAGLSQLIAWPGRPVTERLNEAPFRYAYLGVVCANTVRMLEG